MNEVNLVWLYPDILNLHGERGSVQAFQKVAENLDIKLNITRIDSYSQEIDLENADIIFAGPGELKVIENVRKSLDKESLNKFVDSNKYFICIGTTGTLLAKETIRENGEKVEGLGILNITGKERKMVVGDDLQFTITKTKQEIIGSQIHMVDFCIEREQSLGTVTYGYGNCR